MRALSLCVLVVFAAALAAAVEPGRACSCAVPDPRDALAKAGAAFVGTLVSRRQFDDRAVLVFSVERGLKGPLGKTVEVITARDGAGCGIEAPVGSRVGLVLDRRGGAWHGHLCAEFAPEDLLAAALPLPRPNGIGPAGLFVGGGFGPARVLALDHKGRTIAYGKGHGATSLLSPCPGGERLAEVANLNPGSELAIRDTRTLRVIRRQALQLPGGRYPVGLLCEGETAASVVIFAAWGGDAGVRSAIYRLAGHRLSALWNGTAFLSSLTEPVAYLTSFANSRRGCLNWKSCYRLVSVHLRTGRLRIVSLPWSASLQPDESGKRLAGVANLLAARSRVVLVDLTTRPAKVRSAPLAAPEFPGEVFWLPRGRIVFLPAYGRDTARVLDRTLRTRSRFRWIAGRGALAGSTAFGVHYNGTLVSAKLPSGPMRVVRRLPGRPDVIVSASG